LKKRFLITTEDEATWKFDQPVIFLGEWCRLYDRKHIWQNMDAIVAKPYGTDIFTKEKDDLKVKNLEQKIIQELSTIFNENFHTNYSIRFWQIILGTWLRNILNILLNRINTLKQCLDLEEISGTTLYSSEYCSLAIPNLRSGFVNFFDDEKWNNILSGRILSLLDNNKISINYINYKGGKYSYQNHSQNGQVNFKPYNLNSDQLFKKVGNYIYKNYKKITEKFVSNEDAFLINTYLGSKQSIKLELNLGQFPQLWKKLKTNIDTKPNRLLRKNLTEKFLKKSDDDLEKISRNLLFELLPVYYLEGFEELTKIVNQQPWPKSPKFIFTSNNFGTDEFFKLYTATKTEEGSKYYIGQHGNNYFTIRYVFPRIEEQTCDKFLTWGWNSKFSQYIPMFIFNTAGRKKKYDKKGGLLLVERPQTSRSFPWDVHADFNHYFKEQTKFVSKLVSEPMQKLTIRLSKTRNNKKLCEVSRWLDFNKSLKIDDGNTVLKNLIAESRLVVHSYDTSGLLENLSQNIPTLVFWQNGFDHLRDSVKSDYQVLVDNGIIYFSAESIANKVNEIWYNVDKWWFQKNVQEAITFFCDKYAKKNDYPIKTLVSYFKKKENK
jgi:putative transferase (TIGR04331 family)